MLSCESEAIRNLSFVIVILTFLELMLITGDGDYISTVIASGYQLAKPSAILWKCTAL